VNYRDITLTNGIEVRVYAPPSLKINQLLLKKYPEPRPPVVEEVTASGSKMRMIIEDDPTYLIEKAKMAALRDEETNELNILFALKDARPPKGFDVEALYGDMIRLIDPDWQPRQSNEGSKLDYIEWELLANPADAVKIQEILAELMGIDLEVVSRIEDSFRGNVEGKTS